MTKMESKAFRLILEALDAITKEAELFDEFHDPIDSPTSYAALYLARSVLDPFHYQNDHPCIKDLLEPLLAIKIEPEEIEQDSEQLIPQKTFLLDLGV